MMQQWGWGQHWGMNGYGGVVMILFWAVVIAGIVLLIMQISRSPGRGAGGEAPVEILRKRYARGEITKAEYEEKLKDLQ